MLVQWIQNPVWEGNQVCSTGPACLHVLQFEEQAAVFAEMRSKEDQVDGAVQTNKKEGRHGRGAEEEEP